MTRLRPCDDSLSWSLGSPDSSKSIRSQWGWNRQERARPSAPVRSRLRIEADPLPLASAPVAPPERQEDEQDVKPEKGEDRPGPERSEDNPYREAERRDRAHEQTEPGRSK